MIKRLGWIILFFWAATLAAGALTPAEVVAKLTANFSKIKDARFDVELSSGVQLLGCGGLQVQKGKALFKYPDQFKAKLDNNLFIIKGNFIRWIKPDGKLYYVRLIHAPDFSVGFNPELMTFNFNLKMIKEASDGVVIEGIPKPGVLKNINKVTFFIDPINYLVRRMDLGFVDKKISGYINIDYEKINGLWVPVAAYGRSALELYNSALVGLVFDLRGSNFQLNTSLPASVLN